MPLNDDSIEDPIGKETDEVEQTPDDGIAVVEAPPRTRLTQDIAVSLRP